MSRRRLAATAAAFAVALAALTAGPAVAAAPPPCGGQPQISDPDVAHHINTDVTSAWLSEAAGRLQAAIRVRWAVWEPAHEDSGAAGFAFLFDTGGQTRYVRVQALRNAPAVYDYGTWTGGGGFVTAGYTTGELVSGSGGTATIDVPPGTGAVPGAVLVNSFVLTYDGGTTEPHWVDRAPGGVTPAGTEYGADYVVGACNGAPGATAVSAVRLAAPSKRVGSGSVTVSGSVAPARGGVGVELTVRSRRTARYRLTTGAGGKFRKSVRLDSTSTLRAAAGGIRSTTLTVAMHSRTRIEIRRLRGAGVLVRGRVSPALPGRVLLLRSTEIRSTAKTVARRGRFTFRLRRPPRGRYQAVFIPARDRAERSVSNKGVIR